MKVRELCYSGTLSDTPMKLSKGYLPADVALPTVSDTYLAKKKVKELASSKLTHLKQMCTNFILKDEWHEIVKDT